MATDRRNQPTVDAQVRSFMDASRQAAIVDQLAREVRERAINDERQEAISRDPTGAARSREDRRLSRLSTYGGIRERVLEALNNPPPVVESGIRIPTENGAGQPKTQPIGRGIVSPDEVLPRPAQIPEIYFIEYEDLRYDRDLWIDRHDEVERRLNESFVMLDQFATQLEQQESAIAEIEQQREFARELEAYLEQARTESQNLRVALEMERERVAQREERDTGTVEELVARDEQMREVIGERDEELQAKLEEIRILEGRIKDEYAVTGREVKLAPHEKFVEASAPATLVNGIAELDWSEGNPTRAAEGYDKRVHGGTLAAKMLEQALLALQTLSILETTDKNLIVYPRDPTRAKQLLQGVAAIVNRPLLLLQRRQHQLADLWKAERAIHAILPALQGRVEDLEDGPVRDDLAVLIEVLFRVLAYLSGVQATTGGQSYEEVAKDQQVDTRHAYVDELEHIRKQYTNLNNEIDAKDSKLRIKDKALDETQQKLEAAEAQAKRAAKEVAALRRQNKSLHDRATAYQRHEKEVRRIIDLQQKWARQTALEKAAEPETEAGIPHGELEEDWLRASDQINKALVVQDETKELDEKTRLLKEEIETLKTELANTREEQKLSKYLREIEKRENTWKSGGEAQTKDLTGVEGTIEKQRADYEKINGQRAEQNEEYRREMIKALRAVQNFTAAFLPRGDTSESRFYPFKVDSSSYWSPDNRPPSLDIPPSYESATAQ